ncbi:YheO-like protein [Bordetella bronchiseptica MBORD678]|nr:YheO-like protein [Bordetella bronchiseptica 3E44]KDC44127.1 YheO-like protein [Bordetella bronchiseptica M435/02/3]KDC44771.1 YheO-like protein [Bordetella bronchiseptica M85/00/2]KDC63088.1 YheO-like protein [Bordetella bronchiseptica MBORD595]KDC64283.1 YheO-like protein [Bordetella bronchiseptica MBORD624]KDC74120.1 YheO-like protein [Bordetella bronchiseptica MBORD632]KDC77504.1 YheO-like protein [Bordetella bronchiseptica MBORD635]KDC83997.1 YheO-like protein [Bordetella bronchisept
MIDLFSTTSRGFQRKPLSAAGRRPLLAGTIGHARALRRRHRRSLQYRPIVEGPLMAKRQGSKENQALVEQVMQIAAGLGETLAPFTEVVVHDLRTPRHAILAIHNNLSGRTVGDPATELGLARIADNNYPQIIANYPNKFADGRRSKSTSIGIKDSEGRYVAALCLNVDVTLFKGLASILEKFSSVEGDTVRESLDPASADAIRARIDQFALDLATTPQALGAEHRRALMQQLRDEGYLDLRRAKETVAEHLGVSRATVYKAIK